MTTAREPAPTVACIDDSCAYYRPVFPNVRQFEQCSRLERGPVAETKRTSVPRLARTAKAVRLGGSQALHHFLAEAGWSVEEVRARRLELTRQGMHERPCIPCIDETGERTKGKTTDYAAHMPRTSPSATSAAWPTASTASTASTAPSR